MMDINPITVTTHPDEVASKCVNLGPYRPYLTVQPQVVVAAFNPTEFAMTMANKEDQKETDKLRSGFNKMRSMLVGGKLKNIKSGKLGAIVLPVITAAFIECNKSMTKVEKKKICSRKWLIATIQLVHQD